ncbi:MAG TPA: class I tRNA ligase family protein, partial [Planctomycetota bacterium]|nr:class I tRNA ligase family protein [Planctomycetota bacterium]
MELELSTKYSANEAETRWYDFWEKKGYFHVEPDASKKPYTIVIPPPNVTGILTLGHVLNNTLQDILIRWRRMQGFAALWLPGTDHAGIATQNVVEKRLAKQGTSRHDLGREKFIQTVWDWKNEHHSIIISQLKRLGCSCDWERERFTLDEGLSRAVAEVFVKLYEKGLIYRDVFIINWCPRCCTALSDEESEHRELTGALYYIRYPIAGSDEHITVATTRPETMLGDTAVAVHPEDARYKHLIGKKVLLPLMNREIPIIADPLVDPQFGTGAVKVTPSHDPNDFEMGRRHKLEFVTVIGEDGKMTAAAGKYQGLDRFACRKQVV